MEIVYVRGGDKTAPEIARESGMLYGTRHDYTPYDTVYMLDINWKRFYWTDYLNKVKKYTPVMAMCADYERPECETDYQWYHRRRTLYQQIRDLKPLVKYVMVCPKFTGAIAHIPTWCIIAISVPTSYAGFLPEYKELNGRRVHLLGGRPEIQADMIKRLRGLNIEIVSVDGSYHAMKAGHGQWFSEGRWLQVRSKTISNIELTIGSGRNIVKLLRAAYEVTQPPLF